MRANSGVLDGGSNIPQTRQWIPKIPSACFVGICLLIVVWLWAVLLRGRGDLSIQKVGTVCAAAFVILLASGLNLKILSHCSHSVGQELKYAFRFCFLAFLLLAVFLPESLLGRPLPYLRSCLLLVLTLLLYLSIGLVASYGSSGTKASHLITPGRILVPFCVLYFLLTSWFTLAKLYAFGYVGQDIAYFTQCLYTTLHGHLLYSNMYQDLLYSHQVWSDYAGHNQPVLFFFLPFYLVHKSASTMLIVRNVSVVMCAWPVYLIARRIVTPIVAVIAAIAFLLSPVVLYQNLYDFAPLSLAAFPLLFTLYYYLEGNFKAYLIALTATQLVREDLVFLVFGLGLLALWERRSARWFAVPCALAAGWSLLTWKVVFPYFLHGARSAVASCFGYLGHTPSEIVRGIARHPAFLLSRENLIYTKQMVDSLGGILYLLNPLWLLSTPYIAINLLAQGGGCNTAMIYRHYSFIPATVLFVSFLLSVKAIGAAIEGRGRNPALAQTTLLLFVMAASLLSTVFVTGKAQLEGVRSQTWHAEARQVAHSIPPAASVAVPRYMLPIVANRSGLYLSLRLLEYHHPDAQYIVLDKDWNRMAATAQWKKNYFALWDMLKVDSNYSVIYDSSNYTVFKLCQACTPDLPHRIPRQTIHE